MQRRVGEDERVPSQPIEAEGMVEFGQGSILQRLRQSGTEVGQHASSGCEGHPKRSSLRALGKLATAAAIPGRKGEQRDDRNAAPRSAMNGQPCFAAQEYIENAKGGCHRPRDGNPVVSSLLHRPRHPFSAAAFGSSKIPPEELP
jgi:hypothetical protein